MFISIPPFWYILDKNLLLNQNWSIDLMYSFFNSGDIKVKSWKQLTTIDKTMVDSVCVTMYILGRENFLFCCCSKLTVSLLLEVLIALLFVFASSNHVKELIRHLSVDELLSFALLVLLKISTINNKHLNALVLWKFLLL